MSLGDPARTDPGERPLLRLAEGVASAPDVDTLASSAVHRDWPHAQPRLRLIGRHQALELALRRRGVELEAVEGILRTGELGLMPLTPSTPVPDLERWLGPGGLALPVLMHADSVAMGPPLGRCGGELAQLFSHNAGTCGEPSTALLEAAAERIEACLRRAQPWSRMQWRGHEHGVIARDWSPSEPVLRDAEPWAEPLALGNGKLLHRLALASMPRAALRSDCLSVQFMRHGFDSPGDTAQRIHQLLSATFLGPSEHGLSLRPLLSIEGSAGQTRLLLQVEDGILVASETWVHGEPRPPRLGLACGIEHAARSRQFGLLGRSLPWLDAGAALARLRIAAAQLGLAIHEAAMPAAADGRGWRPSIAEGQDLAFALDLGLLSEAPRRVEPLPADQRFSGSRSFLRQGPEPAGLLPLIDQARPSAVEPGLSLLLVHRTRADRLLRRIYRGRSGRWEALDTLDSPASGLASTIGAYDQPGNRLYLLGALPGERPGQSVHGYLRRARDAGEWSQRLRLRLAAHGLSGYRLGRFDADELVDALPTMQTTPAHVLTALAIGIEAPAGLAG